MHIHEFGDLSEGGNTTGEHFNPTRQVHGGNNDKTKHLGDLGNIKANEKGFAYSAFSNQEISLFGENSIMGRSVVIKEKVNDLGKKERAKSKKIGNSGKAIAFGVIGFSDSFKNLPP
jgi:Cu-Zn family superoxide dismutase